jgi:diacylglycerol kinase (ATP)
LSSAPATPGAAGPYAGRTFVILNPAAGQEDMARLRRRIGGALAERDAPFDMVVTAHAGHATHLARDAAALGYRAVCVVGGDGTLAEVATGLAGTGVPMALIPRGTGNQVAQNLHLPLDVDAAVEVAVHGEPTPLDLGAIGGRAFALVAGAGFDAAVMASATRALKERWGFGAYVIAAVKEALAAQPIEFRLVVDGRELRVSAVSVMIANVGEIFTHYLPFSFPLAPRESPLQSWQDGMFDVVVLGPRNFSDLALVLWQAARRQFPGDERLLHLRGRDVSIEADPAIRVQIDGDPAGTTPVHATVLPAAVLMLLPR